MGRTIASLILFPVAAALAQPQIGGCPVFPPNNAWNTPIDRLPVLSGSDRLVDTIGSSRPLHPDFGSGLYQGRPIGIPFVTVSPDQSPVRVTFQYADESDPGPYPIPPGALIEGGAASTGDRHVLVLQRGACVLYELFDSHPQADGSWRAGSGAVFPLRSNRLRPSGWTSADAAGLPVVPGLVRYEEVAAGEIAHAIRFTATRTRRSFVWPARHFASTRTGPEFPAMGQRFRLRANFDISGFHPENQVLLRAFKKYGLILADNGGDWFVSGVPDERWNNDRLRELQRIAGSNFEAVDVSELIVDDSSGEARQSPSKGARLVHGATGQPGPLAPGLILTLYAPEPASAVRFDGMDAEILYRSPLQINLIAPSTLAAGSSTLVEATSEGRTVWQATEPVAASRPGIFGVLNQDFSINSPSSPAPAGSSLLVFGAGAGVARGHRVTLDDATMELDYSGPAPGFTPALTQINARIPEGAAGGSRMVIWIAGDTPSPPFPVVIR
ncbi:MAG: hypothetical protein R2762_12040 [Bryobacteraceae bacterium]